MKFDKIKRSRKVIVYIIILFILYLIIPLKMGMRYNFLGKKVTHIEIIKYSYSLEKNRAIRNEKELNDPIKINELLNYIDNLNGILSIKTMINPYGFSTNSKIGYYNIGFYNKNNKLIYICIDDKYIAINKKIFKQYRILNQSKYLDKYFDNIN